MSTEPTREYLCPECTGIPGKSPDFLAGIRYAATFTDHTAADLEDTDA